MKKVLDFLSELKDNNNREWFEANRKHYETAKSELIDFVSGLISEIAVWDAEIADLQAKSCIFRINRDTRFSKDKSPYKSNMGAFISKGGKKTAYAGYYVHVEPGANMIAGGIYMPPPEDLKKIRQEIDYNADRFNEIITHKDFTKAFKALDSDQTLKTAPKGYEPENPMIAFLKLKSFTVSRILTDTELLDKNFMAKTVSDCKAMYPLLQFLNQAVEA